MNKKRNLAILFFSLIVFSSFASAVGDVAYIYKRAYKVDQNIISAFNSSGLSVDLVSENSITSTSLNPYKIIFIGDELFSNPSKIPVYTKPTIIANYYNAPNWGYTDAEGVSQLAANHPLSVIINNQMKQVYTAASEGIGGAAISYYYLDEHNKAPAVQTVALTETTSSGSNFGDVIAYVPPGARLLNGKTQNAKLCFYGIVKSDFWTQDARNLFANCIGYVASQCSSNADCPTSNFTGAPFCQNGDVYRMQNSFTCQPVTVINQCVNSNNSVLVQDCQFGCENGQCIQIRCSTNADCNDNNSSTADICQNPGTQQSSCINPQINCFTNSDCGTDGFSGNAFCSSNNVSRNFTSYTCNNAGTASSFCSSNVSQQTLNQCANACQNGACVTFACTTNSQCNDQNPLTFDECINPGTIVSQCRNTPINCASNLDCGTSGFTGTEFCQGNNVVKNFQNATCLNPGTLQSSCSNSVVPQVLQQCFNACFQGVCIACDSNADCNDNNSSTNDVCLNPGTLQSSCSNSHITCSSNLDCGTSGFQGAPFCSTQGDVVRTFVNYTCNNPGTTQSSCSTSQQTQLVQDCLSSCTNGACVSCNANSDCNDNNPLTIDTCLNPSTPASQCRNTPINCASNLDCGTSGFTGTEYCSADNVFKNFQNATCVNPGTLNSFCNLQTSQVQINSCPFACFNGGCIACDSNLDCNDNNAGTNDVCNNPGTPQSFCSHQNNNQTINCFTNSDCGATTNISAPFCSAQTLSNLVMTWTCNNAGTTSSFCSSAISQHAIQTCPQFCSNGACMNIQCFTNSDCNDSNTSTLDLCNNPGTTQSYCTNNPISVICSSNADCGTDGFVNGNICVGTDITRLVQNFTCNNAGTASSFCSSTLTQLTTQTCNFACQNGQCVTPAVVCGNGVLESGEQCDDGNLVNNDGCSSSCQIETPPQCTNQCTQGDRQCLDSQHYRICADFNGDGCTEWSLTATCGALSSCVNGRCN